jgi:hypothetical protein
MEEARVQYARILREFVDFADLARLSQKQLSQNPPSVARVGTGTTGDGTGTSFAARAAATSNEERKLLLQEIALLEKEFAQAQALIQSGNASTSSVIPIQREILQLKRQLLRYENGTDSAPAPRTPNPAAPGSPDPDPAKPAAPALQKR